MKYVYPAIFRQEPEGGYFVFFPDIHRGGTHGEDMIDSMEMAEDFLCLALYDMEEDGEEIPTPSNIRSFDLQSDDFTTLISANTDDYRRRQENKVVKKTLTIPSWLNVKAEAARVNFSQTLQKALKEELKIAE